MSNTVLNDIIEKLINKILSISGDKIITLSTNHEQFKIDIGFANSAWPHLIFYFGPTLVKTPLR